MTKRINLNSLKKVLPNIPVKIRFLNGGDILIRIYEQHPSKSSPGLPVSKNAPLAQALLGKPIGSKVEYKVGETLNHVLILDL